ncbi:MAG: anaerobic sulfatase maturase [Candidatus Omnitrophica bacterium]|nr:anaerobic sulfatase maturase [Candidatus Omnitrophota bacterium]MCM8816288.1 anaerobic sulfatase maturase [Candidatus Omnitrophota bacterium]
MKQFSLLIKPTSFDCNSDCTYCFYKGLPLYRETKHPRMGFDVLEKLVEKYLKTQQVQYIFSWQGGEPLLMGLDFYKKVIDLQKGFASPGSVIGNGLQTNGYLLDQQWAEFLSQNNFLIGMSIDGPEEIHNRFRIALGIENAFRFVMKAIEKLQRFEVAFNTLTVVTSAHAGRAKQVYTFLKDIGSEYHQYIPCVEYDRNSKKLPWTIEAKDWGLFLCELFNAWINDNKKVSIRLFDSILLKLLEKQPGICQMEKNCCQYFVIEHNGDVFPCDFFVRAHTFLGNIQKDDWKDLLNSEKYKKFGLKKSLWHPDCDRCEFLKFCAGDCQKHRISKNQSERTKSVLCEGWKIFYKETMPEFKKIVDYIKSTSAEF